MAGSSIDQRWQPAGSVEPADVDRLIAEGKAKPQEWSLTFLFAIGVTRQAN